MTILQNLDRLHESVRSDVEAYCHKVISALGPGVKSISAYGSATGPDFIRGKSNVNLVIVAADLSQSVLTRLLEVVKWGAKRKIVPPLLLTADYIATSLDVFAIEFAEIKADQVLLMGEDHFSSIDVVPAHLRLECESQLKSAVLRTRQAYLEVGLAKKGAESVLHTSLTSLIPVFRAMLRLKGVEVPRPKLDVVRSVGEVFGVDTEPFVAILKDKAGDEKIGGKEAHGVLGDYVTRVEELAARVDKL
ncbi:MAG: hypothetical protein ABIJ00_11600 [Candidatus Eisenbacteria bacterium]